MVTKSRLCNGKGGFGGFVVLSELELGETLVVELLPDGKAVDVFWFVPSVKTYRIVPIDFTGRPL
jgi:hypothetical protein